MTRAEKLALLAKHAPILWLHENEVFLPQDCKVAVEVSDLFRDGHKVGDAQQPGSIDDLGQTPNSKKCYLKMRDLDLQTFVIPPQFAAQIPESGPEGVGRLARLLYGCDPNTGNPFNDPNGPKYYGRISQVTLSQASGEAFAHYCNRHHPEIYGTYQVLEYFYYYVFNDSWHKHQGDWDSKVEIYLRNGQPQFMVTHMHTCRWVSSWPGATTGVKEWLAQWNNLGEHEFGPTYHLMGHPYVFIAIGAHGAYPTPGISIHGAGLGKANLIADTDERQLGGTCILPDMGMRATVTTNIGLAGVDTTRTRYLHWQVPEMVDKQPWLKYEGKWGEDTRYLGWDGPQKPPISKRLSRVSLRDAVLCRYEGGGPMARIHLNRHEVNSR